MFVVADGIGVASHVLSGHAAHFPGVGYERIDFDGSRSVGFGAGIVFEVVFSYGTQKIWFCQIWLGVNYAVEILY